MDVAKLLESKAKKWPGRAQVVSLLTVIAALTLNKPEKELALWQTALVLALAVLFHLMGTMLDDVAFDPLYGLKPTGVLKRAWRFIARGLFFPIKWIVDQLPGAKDMVISRRTATEVLRGKITGSQFVSRTDEDCSGIYASATALFEGSDSWDDHVKPWLELSKAIRSFVWPLFAIFLYDIGHGRWQLAWLDRLLSAPILNWLAWWQVSLAALVLALVLYVWLRVFHMRAMYRLVSTSEYIALPTGLGINGEYRTALPARHLSIGEKGGDKKSKQPPVFLLVAIK